MTAPNANTPPMILGFAHQWPIAQTMAFEQEYHPNLRLTLHEKTNMLGYKGARAMCVWMFDRDTRMLVGESYGVSCRDTDFREGEPGYDDLRPWLSRRSPRALYCYSTTILTPYQGRGFGTILKAYFLGMASEHYPLVVGHARHGRSHQLSAAFGATFGTTYHDWYSTKETYTFYQLDLKGAR